MRIGIVGGGVLGMTLAHRLGRMGHSVELLEAAPELGGLAAPHDYGRFVWDRFYHCILPTDAALIGLLGELGLAGDLRWTRTGTGYYAGGVFHRMNGNADFLRFPLLTLVDKARLGATVIYATRFADPWRLYRVTAAEWLTRLVGARGYRVFWKPLLMAKFGPYHDRVAAVFIWATLTRLLGARSASTAREKLGYVSGGYRKILGALSGALEKLGVSLRTSAPVRAIRAVTDGAHGKTVQCEVDHMGGGSPCTARYDQVFFTAPTGLARPLVAGTLAPHVERTARDYPTSEAYLGVACLVLALQRKLTDFYVLNIGDPRVELTGLIEMTNLIDPRVETDGLSLVYLPRYLDSADPILSAPDEEIESAIMTRGLRRLFPDLADRDIAYRGVHRARYVQPLPLVRKDAVAGATLPPLERPFTILNTSMLSCATLNNNEVVGLVDRFVDRHGPSLR